MPTPTGFVKVTLHYRRLGDPDPYENVLAYERGTFDTQTDCDALSTAIGGFVKPALDNQTTYEGLTAGIGNPSGDIILDSVAGNGVGTHAHGAGPPAVASLVRKSTGSGGRKNRGRIYWPSAPFDEVGADGSLDSTFRNLLDTQVQHLLTTPGGGLAAMVLLHSDASAPTVVTALAVEAFVATQRRRQR